MSVLKPRNRLINFRLTEEEFVSLRDACRNQGARSISDFARSAVMTQAENPTAAAEGGRVEELLASLDKRMGELFELVQAKLPEPKLPEPKLPEPTLPGQG
jgi:uncharacterized protein (DUF1778 family)